MGRRDPLAEGFGRRALRLLVRLITATIVLFACVVVALVVWRWHDRREPVEPTQIFPGILYRCIRVPESFEQGGLAHVCEIDLSNPHVQLWTTPIDPVARQAGWEYRLRRVGSVCEDEHLAVVVNGALFATPARYFPLPGDFARSAETVVSDYQVNHVDPNSYLIWFDDDLSPHWQTTKPPLPENLARAKWGIGIQECTLIDGQPRPGTGTLPDRRTMVAFNSETRRLWLASFEKASARSSAQFLADMGAREGGMIDGGTSTSMALGKDAQGVRPGLLIGGLRPVATQFGVRVVEQR